jgi:hypothetical protein
MWPPLVAYGLSGFWWHIKEGHHDTDWDPTGGETDAA